MKDTLATLDLAEKPGQRITTFRHIRHYQQDGPVETEPGERIFSSGPQHGFYSYTIEKEEEMGHYDEVRERIEARDKHIHDACIVDAKAGEPPRRTERRWHLGRQQELCDDFVWRYVDHRPDTHPAVAARLETDSAKRKDVPIYSGFVRYFPDAMAEVARLSKSGNDKHNPGEPMHWSRSKSDDHLDCLARHLAEAGTLDSDNFYHDVKIVWRSLANLQTLLERTRNLPPSPGSKT